MTFDLDIWQDLGQVERSQSQVKVHGDRRKTFSVLRRSKVAEAVLLIASSWTQT